MFGTSLVSPGWLVLSIMKWTSNAQLVKVRQNNVFQMYVRQIVVIITCMSVQAAMLSGQLGLCAAAEPAADSSGQLAAIGTTTAPESWQQEKQKLVETVAVLEKHKDWADKKIDQLIKRVTEAERPQKDEAYRLRDEVCNATLPIGQFVHIFGGICIVKRLSLS